MLPTYPELYTYLYIIALYGETLRGGIMQMSQGSIQNEQTVCISNTWNNMKYN